MTLGDEVGAAKIYARAPGWPPRVRDWLARLLDEIGEPGAAQAARDDSTAMWKAVAERRDLPADLTRKPPRR